MSWQPVSYWALRCDGEVSHGRQCTAVVYDDPNCHLAPVGWTGDGNPEQLPTMYTSKPYMPHPGWLQQLGWLHTGNRVLCPDHVQALEFMAEAEMTGLPFEQGVQQ